MLVVRRSYYPITNMQRVTRLWLLCLNLNQAAGLTDTTWQLALKIGRIGRSTELARARACHR